MLTFPGPATVRDNTRAVDALLAHPRPQFCEELLRKVRGRRHGFYTQAPMARARQQDGKPPRFALDQEEAALDAGNHFLLPQLDLRVLDRPLNQRGPPPRRGGHELRKADPELTLELVGADAKELCRPAVARQISLHRHLQVRVRRAREVVRHDWERRGILLEMDLETLQKERVLCRSHLHGLIQEPLEGTGEVIGRDLERT